MFGMFYLATYKEQYKLPHKTRHKTAGESPQLPPPWSCLFKVVFFCGNFVPESLLHASLYRWFLVICVVLESHKVLQFWTCSNSNFLKVF